MFPFASTATALPPLYSANEAGELAASPYVFVTETTTVGIVTAALMLPALCAFDEAVNKIAADVASRRIGGLHDVLLCVFAAELPR